MICFPRFDQYASQSYLETQSRPGSKRSSFSSSISFKRQKKSKKSILMALLYSDDPTNNFDLPTSQDDFAYINGSQPRLKIPWEKLSICDPNYDVNNNNFPTSNYNHRYLAKLGIEIDEDINPPYEFGYYYVPEKYSSQKKKIKLNKKKLVYGARCGHCSKFIKIRNECSEGGFLSYIDYFRHWIINHNDFS